MREIGEEAKPSGAGDAGAAVIVYNTRTTSLKVNLNQLGARYEGHHFGGVWNGEGVHVVEQGGLHNLEVPARDAVVLVQGERA
jgi:hypothetical protein